MASSYKEITSLSTRGDKDGFSNSLSVWINKPHVVNRRLCGAKIISCEAWSKSDLRFPLVIDKLKHLNYRLSKSDEHNLETRLTNDQDITEIAKSKLINLDNTKSVASSNQKTYSVEVNCDGLSAECECSNCRDEMAVDSTLIVTEENKSVKAKPKGKNSAFNELIEQVELESVNTSETEVHVMQQKQSECNLGKFKASETHSGIGKIASSASVRNTDADFDHRFGNESSEGIAQVDGLAGYKDDVIVIIRELVPKQPDRHENIPELIIYDKSCEACAFYPLHKAGDQNLHKAGDQYDEETTKRIEVAYEFTYCTKPVEEKKEARITLSVSCSSFSDDSRRKLSLTWLQGQLLTKIARWSEEANLKTSLTSLKLVPLEDYNALYNDLKNKYGQHFAKIWPEKTDPQKYVFEDVAIATYLLDSSLWHVFTIKKENSVDADQLASEKPADLDLHCFQNRIYQLSMLLWKLDREKKGLTKKQSFLDMGCGNGLLVHILAAEGHPGYGVDVRKRSIWDLYGDETILKESAITPSKDSLFPDSDWLIGNHSDELTPWIPVMAARSSYSCCYFVLPCCHHDFDSKFSQSVVGGSQYREYLNYIQLVGENCGFTVEEDMLRIPSTKRVCFIGRTRSYPLSDETAVDEKRTFFINSRCNQNTKQKTDAHVISSGQKDKNGDLNENWSADFAPRSKVETTRNCVTVRKETKEAVIRQVFDAIMNCDACEMRQLEDGRSWRKGGKLPICDVVKLFDGSLLQELKSECGGIQTLLRNSSQIFQVSSGVVQLRDFTLADPWGRKQKGRRTDNSDYFKTSLCWFNTNHPDGCPRISELCDYAHCDTELREKPQKVKKLT